MMVSRRSLATAPMPRAHAAAFSARRSTVLSSDRASAKARVLEAAEERGLGRRPAHEAGHARPRARVRRRSAFGQIPPQKIGSVGSVPCLSRVTAGGYLTSPAGPASEELSDRSRPYPAGVPECPASRSSASRARFSRSARSPKVLAASRRCAFSSSSCRIRARQASISGRLRFDHYASSDANDQDDMPEAEQRCTSSDTGGASIRRSRKEEPLSHQYYVDRAAL